LIKSKEKVRHGEWESWFKSSVQLPFSGLTQAKNYMRLARNKELSNLFLELSCNLQGDALKIDWLKTAMSGP